MDVTLVQAWVDIVSTVSMPLMGGAVWWLRAQIRTEITKQTLPIQKDANGGWSLPDAIRELKETRTEIMGEVNRVHGRVTELATDVAHLKGRFDQQVWDGGERRQE